ncbi:MAG: thiol-disulfide oxidoreductase ResA [Chloroflexota bacterium]
MRRLVAVRRDATIPLDLYGYGGRVMLRSMVLRQRVAPFLIVIVFIAGYLLFRPATPGVVGMAPNFQLRSTSGRTVSVAEYRGHPVLLNFFATWCTTCKKEFPALARAQVQHPGLIALLIDERESAAQVRIFLRGLRVPLPALLDADGSVASRYAISGQPVTVWVAPSGRVRAKSVGSVDSWIINARYRDLTTKK